MWDEEEARRPPVADAVAIRRGRSLGLRLERSTGMRLDDRQSCNPRQFTSDLVVAPEGEPHFSGDLHSTKTTAAAKSTRGGRALQPASDPLPAPLSSLGHALSRVEKAVTRPHSTKALIAGGRVRTRKRLDDVTPPSFDLSPHSRRSGEGDPPPPLAAP